MDTLDLLEPLRARKNRPYLVGEGLPATGNEVAAAVERICSHLHQLDLQPAELVAVRTRPVHDTVRVLLALWRLGYPTLLIGERVNAKATQDLLRRTGCRLLIDRDDGSAGEATCAPLETLTGAGSSAVSKIQLPARSARCLPGAATVVATSGSTSAPKLVVHSLQAHVTNARTAILKTALAEPDRWLMSLPMHHVAGVGILFRTLLSGAEVALCDDGMTVEQAVCELHPTHVSLVPTQLQRMLANPDQTTALWRCKTVVLGGDKVAQATRLQAIQRGIHLLVTYGATETASMVAGTDDPRSLMDPGCIGRPFGETTIKIGEDARIAVRCESLLSGYLQDNGEIHSPLVDGYWVSQDRGRIDSRGELFVEGRADRMMISGGENIFPEEIEALLAELPGIASAAVVAVTHPEFGQRPEAFLSWSVSDPPMTSAELRQVIAPRLDAFKLPDSFWRMPEELSQGMKPDLVELTRRANDATERAQLRPV